MGIPLLFVQRKTFVQVSSAFKAHFGIWFFQGALLTDDEQKLVNAQEGKTKAMRQLKFESMEHLQKELATINTPLLLNLAGTSILCRGNQTRKK